MAVKKGRQTYILGMPVSTSLWASSGGKKEGEGPLGKNFDLIFNDSTLGEKSWEKGESSMIENTLTALLRKGDLKSSDIDLVIAGDLMNQCTASTYGLRYSGIPFYGIYGACSNMGEGISIAALLIESGAFRRICAMTSSHFCTAERQFRFPLEYGGVKSPTSQWTVTSCASVLLEAKNKPPFVRAVTIGTVTDLGVKDISNMGSAMAPYDVTDTPQKACVYISIRKPRSHEPRGDFFILQP